MSLKETSFSFSIKYTWKKCWKIFFGVYNVQTVLKHDVALLKILEFDLNIHLISDAPLTFLSKITFVATNQTSRVLDNIAFPVMNGS